MRKITTNFAIELTAEERRLLKKIYMFSVEFNHNFTDVEPEDFCELISSVAWGKDEVYINNEKVMISYTD